MARGWESKAVESQIEAAENRRPYQPPPVPSSTYASSANVRAWSFREPESCRTWPAALNPKYVAVLERSLGFLDDKLKALAAKA